MDRVWDLQILKVFWGSCGSQLRILKLYYGLLGCVPGESSTQTLFLRVMDTFDDDDDDDDFNTSTLQHFNTSTLNENRKLF